MKPLKTLDLYQTLKLSKAKFLIILNGTLIVNIAHQLIQELDYYRSKTDKFDLLILDQDLENLIKKLKDQSNGLYSLSSYFFVSGENEIKESLKDSNSFFNNLKENIDSLIDILGVSYTNNKQELEETIQNARFLAESDRVEFNVLNNSDWNSENYVANEIIHEIEDFAKNELFLSKFTSEILDYDLRNISNEFKDLSTKRLKFLSCKRLSNNSF